jgi:hypothetical protein
VGERALLMGDGSSSGGSGGVRSASVYTDTACTLLELSRKDFWRALPPFCIQLAREYCQLYQDPGMRAPSV